MYVVYKPVHDKTNNMTWAPSEDSDQPGHPPSLIRVFTVRRKKPQFLVCQSTQRKSLISLGGSESLLGAKSFSWFCRAEALIMLNIKQWVFGV